MKSNRILIIILLIIIGSLINLFWPRSDEVLAHTVLVFAEPEPNTTLDTAPERVRLLFSQPLEPAFSHIAVFDQSGQQVDNHDSKSTNKTNTTLMVTLPPLSTGVYQVRWDITTQLDGHMMSGGFSFSIGTDLSISNVGNIEMISRQPAVLNTSGQWLNLTGLMLLIGLVTFHLFVWRLIFDQRDFFAVKDTEFELKFNKVSQKVGSLGVGLLIIGLVATFMSQSSQYNLFDFNNFLTWLDIYFGAMWLWRLIITLIALFGLRYLFVNSIEDGRNANKIWPWGIALLITGALALTTSLVRHSAALASDDTLLPILANLAHLFAAGIWAGGLVQLGIILWLARTLPIKNRLQLSATLATTFSAPAAGAIGVLLLSGGYLAWLHIGRWPPLFGTAYGLTLLTKLGLALLALSIATVNLLVIKPKLQAMFEQSAADSSASVQNRFTRLVLIEVFLGLFILVGATILVDLQPARDAPLLAAQANQMALEQSTQDLNMTVTVEPALVGENQFNVFLTDQNEQPIDSVSEVLLSFTFLGESRGTTDVVAAPTGNGYYRGIGNDLNLVGPWQIEATIRRLDGTDIFVPFRVKAGLTGIIQNDSQQTLLEKLVTFLTRGGALITGVFLILFTIGWGFLASQARRQDWQLVPLLLPGFMAFWIGGFQIYTFYSDFTPAKFTTNPVLPDTASITRGQELYMRNCVSCHGPQGYGDGPQALDFFPAPPDFTAGHTGGHPEGDVYYWIREGIGTSMPAYGDELSEEDLWHLVNYVRRLSVQRPVQALVPLESESAQLSEDDPDIPAASP